MKRLALNLFILCFTVFLALELAGFFLGLAHRDLFNTATDGMLETLQKPEAQSRLSVFSQGDYSPVYGWLSSGAYVSNHLNCLRIMRRYTRDFYHERTYTGYDRTQAQVLLIGDSYTYGDEIEDDETIAARIYQQTGVVAANLGEIGFSPLQALMRAEGELDHFPEAHVVILGFMDNDLRRLTDGNRAQMWSWKEPFFFSPYLLHGRLHTIDPHVYDSLDSLRRAVIESEKTEYWARPRYQFPYSVALIKWLISPRALPLLLGKDNTPSYFYQDPELSLDLKVLLTQYAQWAQKHNLTAIAMFIPLNADDPYPSQRWIEEHRGELPANLIVKHVDMTGIDPLRYNVLPNGWCHPSVYGAMEIARQYIPLVRAYAPNWRELLYGPAAMLARSSPQLQYDWQGLAQ